MSASGLADTCRLVGSLRPVYTGDFCGDFSGDFCCDFKRDFAAISNRPCKLLPIQIAVESPVVFTGDLKSLSNRHEIAAKIASVNGPLKFHTVLNTQLLI